MNRETLKVACKDSDCDTQWPRDGEGTKDRKEAAWGGRGESQTDSRKLDHIAS